MKHIVLKCTKYIMQLLSVRRVIYILLFLIITSSISIISYRLHILYKIKYYVDNYNVKDFTESHAAGNSTFYSFIRYISLKSRVPFDKLHLHFETLSLNMQNEHDVSLINQVGSSIFFYSVDFDGHSNKSGEKFKLKLPEIHASFIHLRGIYIDEKTLHDRTSSKGLEFANCEITNAGMEMLIKRFPKLELLDTSDEIICENVHRFKYLKTFITGGDLNPMISAPINLLVLKGTTFNNRNCIALKRLNHIKHIDLELSIVTKELLEVLKTMPNLKVVTLFACQIAEPQICMIAKLNLDELEISPNSIGNTVTLNQFIYVTESIPNFDLLDGEQDYASRQRSRVYFDEPSGYIENCRVLTDAGFIQIKNIKLGDEILCKPTFLPSCHDESASKVVKRKVIKKEFFGMDLRSFMNSFPEDREFIFEANNKSTPPPSLTTPPAQPLYVEGKGWVEAFEVKVGDRLRGKDGPTPVITEVKRIPPEPTYVIRVEGNLSFFVSPPGADFDIWTP